MTYHLPPNCLYKTVRDNTYFLYMTEELKNLLLSALMVSFSKARNLSRYLVMIKLYPLQREEEFKKSVEDRCEDCDYVTDTESTDTDWY